MSLTTRVLIALVAGLGLGLLVSMSGNEALVSSARWIEPLGTLFINAIRMTVIPLVVGSLVAGIAAAPNPGTRRLNVKRGKNTKTATVIITFNGRPRFSLSMG